MVASLKRLREEVTQLARAAVNMKANSPADASAEQTTGPQFIPPRRQDRKTRARITQQKNHKSRVRNMGVVRTKSNRYVRKQQKKAVRFAKTLAAVKRSEEQQKRQDIADLERAFFKGIASPPLGSQQVDLV